MFDLETAKKPQLVDIVTRLQVAGGCEGDACGARPIWPAPGSRNCPPAPSPYWEPT